METFLRFLPLVNKKMHKVYPTYKFEKVVHENLTEHIRSLNPSLKDPELHSYTIRYAVYGLRTMWDDGSQISYMNDIEFKIYYSRKEYKFIVMTVNQFSEENRRLEAFMRDWVDMLNAYSRTLARTASLKEEIRAAAGEKMIAPIA